MITIVASMALSAAVQASAASTQRQQFTTCLRQAVDKANADKLKPDGFEAFARQSCAGQITSFRQGLVNFDVKAGGPRKRAESDADLQIEDYLVGASEKLNPGT
ncbi:MAG TPA: hypothetical protein VK485_06080 [Sphingomicrobium sp.]|nr:hypothetical protein [Sphingomicrobium sp.]